MASFLRFLIPSPLKGVRVREGGLKRIERGWKRP